MRQAEVRCGRRRVRCVGKSEKIGAIRSGALKTRIPGKSIGIGNRDVRDRSLNAVAVRDAENRDLIVVPAAALEIRERVQGDQRSSL